MIKFAFRHFFSIWPRPQSLAGLVRTGFSLVAIVLIIAIVFAIFSVDQLSQQSEDMVRNGVQLTRLSRQLSDTVPAMERNARQYMVVKDHALLESYRDHEQKFLETLDELQSLDISVLGEIDYERMRTANRRINDAIKQTTSRETTTLSGDFPPFQILRQQSRELAAQTNVFIERELNNLQQTAVEARQFLLLSNAALIPAAIFIAVLFTALITRPVRQIESAIRRLGDGKFDQPITIDESSAEMQALASQLDWLRCRILELENEKTKFLQRMSHELKTPLASVREGTDLLMDGATGTLSVEQREVVNILHESGNELQALIENLLNFTAWQRWAADVQLSRFDLSVLVRNVVNRHRLVIQNKQLNIKATESTLMVTADRERLRLALDNLIANAVKFAPDKSSISINCEQSDDQIRIAVTDQGPGIPESEREHIFTPFYQGENNRQLSVRGTGIGLSVVRDSVFAHDGSIRITANEPTGTQFLITLPQPESNT